MGLMQTQWRDTMSAYKDPVMLAVFINSCGSGLPWAMFGSLLTLWLQDEGFSRTQIGFFGLIGLAYALNLLWAPIMDAGALPKAKALGKRRSWILAMQLLIVICVVMVAFVDITTQINVLVLLMVCMAFAGATQDIGIDALRIEMIDDRGDHRKLAVAAAVSTAGWWTGYGMGGAVALGSLQGLQRYFPEHYWQLSYLILGFLMLLCGLGVWLSGRYFPERDSRPIQQQPAIALPQNNVVRLAWKRLAVIYMAPLRSFILRYGFKIGSALLAFIFLFKLGEAFLGRMSIVFYGEFFSKPQIALYSKGLGALSYVLFALVGSFISVRYGLFRGVIIGGILMASTNLLFALLAYYPIAGLFAFAVIADQFTTAISTVAFVAFISQLCDRAHTATQYAAMASIGNFGRTSLAATAGIVVDGLGSWSLFFMITSLMVIPSLLLLLALRSHIAPIVDGHP